MKITLEALQVIESIARCGTFGLAGEELHKAPSSLSYVVQKFESDLGVTVFDRSGHRVRLTRTGALLVEESRQLLRAALDLEERARRVETGWETDLKIVVDAILPFEILTPMIAAFHAENPYTRLQFSQEMLLSDIRMMSARPTPSPRLEISMQARHPALVARIPAACAASGDGS
jgi:DNA-binding transcriptional LysR family regulator